jgi:hypothetical protein
MRRVDVVALVFGLLLTGLAAVSLWASFGTPVDWRVLRIAAPVWLVGTGILGLALSRRSS